MDYIGQATIPRGCLEIWLARLQGEISAAETEFAVARDQLSRKVDKNPERPDLLSALGILDAALGRKEHAIQERNVPRKCSIFLKMRSSAPAWQQT
jgi:hypothetical protein